MILVLVPLVLVLIVGCLFFPPHNWDYRAFWLLHAKIIKKYHTWKVVDYTDKHRYLPARDYSPFYYLALTLTGSRRTIPLLSFLLLLWLMWDYTHSIIPILVLASIPGLYTVNTGGVPGGQADFTLGVFYFGAITCLMRGDWLGGALWLTLCLYTKNEGIPLYVLSLPCFLRLEALPYIFLPLLLFLPWLVVKRGIAGQITDTSYDGIFRRTVCNFWGRRKLLPRILWLTFLHFTKFCVWGLLPVILVITIRTVSPIHFIVLVYYCVIVAVYMSVGLSHVKAGPELEFGYNATDPGASFFRLMLHVIPLLVVTMEV